MDNVPHWEKSKMLSNELDELGFSRKRVEERKLMYERYSSVRYPGLGDIEHKLAGSLREGVGFLLYNDIDILEVDHNIICETNVTREHVEGKTVLKIDENGAAPGYCFLYVVSISDASLNALILKHSHWEQWMPLSNFLFSYERATEIPIMNEFRSCPVQGPSVPIELKVINSFGLFDDIWKYFNFKSDHVLAFPCKVDHILQEWKSRKRNVWPEAKVISEVMTLPTYVVPVGAKDDFNEWRISFVMAEIHLVKSFNDTQTKCYALMKIITKHTLKPVCEDISSYVVKNVMFWLCEKVPTKMFKPKLLMHRLRDALKFLKSAVEQRNLRNYMIPKRNLFDGKLSCNEKTEKMTDMLNKWVEYTSHNFYKKNSHLVCINQEAFILLVFNDVDYYLTRLNCISLSDIIFQRSSLHNIYNSNLLTLRASLDLPEYEKGPINMLSPYPYLLILLLLIPMRLCLMTMLPHVETFISYNRYLVWALFICYLVLFCFIQRLKELYRKPKMIDLILCKRMILYTPKSVQILEEMIVFIFILVFTVLLGFTDLTAGINLPFMCLCFGLVVLSYQLKKFGNQFKVMIPDAYINRLFQIRVLFPLLFAITIYLLW